jgi:hypothetical protein
MFADYDLMELPSAMSMKALRQGGQRDVGMRGDGAESAEEVG